MTSQLLPSYALTLGSQQWTEQALRIVVTLELAPRVDLLTAWLPIAAPLSADRGDRVELKINNGEKEEIVFTGEIDSIQRDFDKFRVNCVNAGGVLARFRPADTYENISAATVINNLLDSMGVDAGVIEAGPDLPFYVADPTRTAWEHIARVAGWGGAVARVGADNKVDASVIDASQADVALLYGREIISLHANKRSVAIDSFVVAGEAGAGDTGSADVLRPSTDFFGGNRPDGPARGKRWQFQPALRTAKSAATAGAALQRQYTSSLDAGYFRAFLQPQLRCGSVVDIQQLPDGLLAGPIWLTRVEHELGGGTATTRVHFHQGGDAFDPSALLGSLASAIGGLL
ncbi:MAG: hypothetical protein JWM78_2123 [Verrucomicrobiaceae bacterium]|nr:hypothetical protein [Verrucomicrobiaceae bacterium]